MEIEGDKTTVELEALVDGVLAEILVPGDTVAAVGAVLAHIQREGSAPVEAQQAVAPPAPAATTSTAAEPLQVSPVARRMAKERGVDLSAVSGSGSGGRITRADVEAALAPASNGDKALAAPAVRRLARDRGVDLAAIVGSGTGGRITRADVEAALAAPPAQAAPRVVEQPPATISAAPQTAPAYGGEREEVTLSQMRKAIARRLSQSMQDMPHFYVTGELDFTDALKALPAGIGINNLVLYLTVRTLKDLPDLNATYEDGHLYHYAHVNLALAVALPNGLITPVLYGADDFSLSGLANRARDLVKWARDGRLSPDEMQGGTFTVSNLGIINQIDQFTAIINPPQVAILAIGAVKERPVVLNGGLHIRTTAHLTLSADHRIVDGLGSARFIETFDKHLQAFNG